jgi:hypothetical protein
VGNEANSKSENFWSDVGTRGQFQPWSQRAYLPKLKQHLSGVMPGLTDAALEVVADVGNWHFADWSMLWRWPGLQKYYGVFADVLAKSPVELLADSARALHLQMRWRRMRDRRLNQPYSPDYFRHSEFIPWLLNQPSSLLLAWASDYVRHPRKCASSREAAFRISRLRPIPLEILWTWCKHLHELELTFCQPTPDEIRTHYLACAAAQWLEWNHARRARYFRPSSGQRPDDFWHFNAALEGINSKSNMQLTVNECTFVNAGEIALAAIEKRRPKLRVAPRPPAAPFRLELVSLGQRRQAKSPPKSDLPMVVCPVCASASFQ